MLFLGKQLIAELMDCDPAVLADVDAIRKSMLEAAYAAGCTIITQTFHHFSPLGVSGAVIIAESHLAIHTWPEYRYAAVDVFTCGDSADPILAVDTLAKALGCGRHSLTALQRGAVSDLR